MFESYIMGFESEEMLDMKEYDKLRKEKNIKYSKMMIPLDAIYGFYQQGFFDKQRGDAKPTFEEFSKEYKKLVR